MLPYLGIGGLAVIAGFLGPHRYSIAVGSPLILFAFFCVLSTGTSTAQKNSRHIFSIGEYKLDGPVAGFSGLEEFSPTEYSILGRPFEGETNYNAPPVTFLGRSWELQLATVDGNIYKIAPSLFLKRKQDADAVVLESLRYCTAELGKPTEKWTGFFIWHAADGNVVLQTAEVADGVSVSLFLTSRSVRNFKRKLKF
jgi:hypothetical protein